MSRRFEEVSFGNLDRMIHSWYKRVTHAGRHVTAMTLKEHIRIWLERDPDPDTRHEVEQLVASGDREELEERFSHRLAFGTAGLRGVIGAGPSRMNRLVVRETTAGLAVYLLQQIPDAAERGVVVGFDARRDSRVFARDAAGVLSARGIRVHLTDREQPTPICSFAVKALGAAAGIVVTASHNPPEYNGYKVYWENGAQIIPPHDAGIAAEIEKAAQEPVPWKEPDVHLIKEDIVEHYLEGVRGLSIHQPDPLRTDFTIAYTSLHGVGTNVALKALAQAGFRDFHTVASQCEPDGRFPTVHFPNPEEPGVMDAVLALAKDVSAELAFANDPDADRLAVAVRKPDGSYRMLTGDQLGVLLAADILELATDPITVATTIVSSRMLGIMAAEKGVDYVETLTGFKWIVNQALERERKGFRFAFGYEEALGYTVGSLVPDKDGVSAMVAFAEMAVACRRKGMTVLDRLEGLYRRYGLFMTAQRSLALDPSATGPSLGDKLRLSPPEIIAGRKVESVLDVERGERRFGDGRTEPSPFPPSDVLVYELSGKARVVVRPSGTEPKIKCYYEIREDLTAEESFDAAEGRARTALQEIIEMHQKELAAL
jgi:phosphomannomutase